MDHPEERKDKEQRYTGRDEAQSRMETARLKSRILTTRKLVSMGTSVSHLPTGHIEELEPALVASLVVESL